jgi:hypothetical protein
MAYFRNHLPRPFMAFVIMAFMTGASPALPGARCLDTTFLDIASPPHPTPMTRR